MAGADEVLGQLVPPELREALRGQALVLRRLALGRRHGRHASVRAGVGLDFRDHRPYVAGDDPRRLDWRAIARRDRPVLRQTDSEDVILGRMRRAAGEIGHWGEYDYVLVNEDVEDCLSEVKAIVTAERMRRSRRPYLTDFTRNLVERPNN